MTDEDDLSIALIGHTGFVGSNLLRQHAFDATFNSATIGAIEGRSFDLVICAGARAEKWKANAEPERDLDNIESLIRALEHVDARTVVLVSTVDVFARPVGVDEDTPAPTAGLHPYGRHRRRLEQVVAGRFHGHVVRLPGLYGPGLKKNVIHDLLHDHEVEKVDPRAEFQFYNINRLWGDIETTMAHDLPLVHLPTEPVSVAEVACEAFGLELAAPTSGTPARYDVRTRYAPLFGGAGAYLEPRDRELAGIAAFVRSERTSTRAGGRR